MVRRIGSILLLGVLCPGLVRGNSVGHPSPEIIAAAAAKFEEDEQLTALGGKILDEASRSRIGVRRSSAATFTGPTKKKPCQPVRNLLRRFLSR